MEACWSKSSTFLGRSSRFIQTMSEGLSEVGQARAWIHLALEKKVLSQHLKELLLNQELLRSGDSHDWPEEAHLRCSLNLSYPDLSQTGSCINLTRSCSLRRNESSSCSTCCPSTLWTISASHVSSPPSVSPVDLYKVYCQGEGSVGALHPPPGLRY